MNTDIEKLIRLATEDGSITDEERGIIIRKAQEMGADIDEVEIMLENFLNRGKDNIKVPKVEKDYKGRKCPYCGAILTEGALVCPECGHELTEESKTSVIVKDNIKIFQQQYDNLDKEIKQKEGEDDIIWEKRLKEAKALLIINYSIPQTKEVLLQWFEFVISKYMSTAWMQNPEEKEAWRGKARQVLSMLQRHTDTDKDLKSTVDYYTKLLEDEEKKTSSYKFWFFGIFVVMMILAALSVVLDKI